ncbi:MAG: DUF4012 domain-containing protein [Candidatus Spechtbacterales bacterium]
MKPFNGSVFDDSDNPRQEEDTAWRDHIEDDVLDLRAMPAPRSRRDRQEPGKGRGKDAAPEVARYDSREDFDDTEEEFEEEGAVGQPSIDGLFIPTPQRRERFGVPQSPAPFPSIEPFVDEENLKNYFEALPYVEEKPEEPQVHTAAQYVEAADNEEKISPETLHAQLAEFDVQDLHLQSQLPARPFGYTSNYHRAIATREITPRLSDFNLIPQHAQRFNSQLQSSRSSHRKRNSIILGVVAAIVGLFALVALQFFALRGPLMSDAQAAYVAMQAGREALLELRTGEAKGHFEDAREAFESIENSRGAVSRLGLALAATVPMKNRVSSGAHLLRAGKQYAVAGYEASSALQIVYAAQGGFTTVQTDEALTDAVVASSEHLERARDALRAGGAELANVRPEDIPTELREDIRAIQQQSQDLERLFEEAYSSLDVLLALLGHERPKTYLFIFQNASELRPTGGFIGSYGRATVDKGAIEELFVNGIYDPDGQLKERELLVVPPRPLQYVTPYWGTRDANWFFDFPTSAEKVISFYEKTGDTGKSIDGVIAITPAVVEELLRITGPIEMPAYEATVTADNFLERVQQETLQDYDRVENKPKQILADMAPVLIERLAGSASTVELLNMAVKALEQKDIMIYARDLSVARFVHGRNWDGALNAPQPSPTTLTDYLAVVISNLGGGKADKYTTSAVATTTRFGGGGSVLRSVTITREHQGGGTPYAWYNKANVGYYKIYVPWGAELIVAEGFAREPSLIQTSYTSQGYQTDALVVGIEETLTKGAGGVDVFQEQGMTVFGGWFTIRPGQTDTVSISYLLPTVATPSHSSYALTVQKQSGVNARYEGLVEGDVSVVSLGECTLPDATVEQGAFSFLQTGDERLTCDIRISS